MAHNCIVVNLDRCTGCYSCEITCKMENDIALGEHWNKMLQRGPFGDYPNMTRYPLPTMCQQCADAPCVHVCPTGAATAMATTWCSSTARSASAASTA